MKGLMTTLAIVGFGFSGLQGGEYIIKQSDSELIQKLDSKTHEKRNLNEIYVENYAILPKEYEGVQNGN